MAPTRWVTTARRRTTRLRQGIDDAHVFHTVRQGAPGQDRVRSATVECAAGCSLNGVARKPTPPDAPGCSFAPAAQVARPTFSRLCRTMRACQSASALLSASDPAALAIDKLCTGGAGKSNPERLPLATHWAWGVGADASTWTLAAGVPGVRGAPDTGSASGASSMGVSSRPFVALRRLRCRSAGTQSL